ncbi:hypothetical protein ROZALSC1DRAFT_29817 [Rozella allomycis CSF55]|uniref:RING-type domain-containing protein n=1 Tax=Rozella allomycis (strain CSF55) TaxID=988480 RepID=A0A4P9YGT4_ROZAC|nr:hypothetical protein ROZALSC1DRAFT_29817 [Rozella allomycis CSF55]
MWYGIILKRISSHGHMACKECWYKNILSQKNEINRQETLFKNQETKKEEKNKLLEEKAKALVIQSFQDSQNHTAPKSRLNIIQQDGPKNKRLRIEYKNVQSEIEKAKEFIEQEESTKKKHLLPSFWVPSLAPEEKQTEINAESVKRYVECPLDSQPITDDQHKKICPCCLKTFNNAMEIIVVKSCSHVYCSVCSDKMLKKTNNCYCCEKKFKDKDLLKIHSEGTGFSGRGNVTVKSFDFAFQ